MQVAIQWSCKGAMLSNSTEFLVRTGSASDFTFDLPPLAPAQGATIASFDERMNHFHANQVSLFTFVSSDTIYFL